MSQVPGEGGSPESVSLGSSPVTVSVDHSMKMIVMVMHLLKGELKDLNAADVNDEPPPAAHHPRHRHSHAPSGQKYQLCDSQNILVNKVLKGNMQTEEQVSNSRPSHFGE